MIGRPGKYVQELGTNDYLIRTSTKLKLHKATNSNESGLCITSNPNIIASVINQQMLNTNSLLSLGSSDISNYLKSNKILQS